MTTPDLLTQMRKAAEWGNPVVDGRNRQGLLMDAADELERLREALREKGTNDADQV